MNTSKSTSSNLNTTGSITLQSKVILVTELVETIRTERITLETLVSLGIDGKGNLELRWVDYPVKLEEKVAIPIPRTHDFSYFASIQLRKNWTRAIVEAEPAALRDQRIVSEAVRILAANLPSANIQAKDVFDLLIGSPNMTVKSVMVADGKVTPLFTGTDADKFRYPRLMDKGMFAVKDKYVMYFAEMTNIIEVKADAARIVHAAAGTIAYLTRVNPAKQVIVASTADGSIAALTVDAAFYKSMQTKVSAKADTKAGMLFVGTPGGNGQGIVLGFDTRGKDQQLTFWPVAAKHSVQDIVSAAC